MERRQYKTPPITEALCAFSFVPDPEWNVMYPSLVYGAVKEEYSGKPREQKLLNVDQTVKEGQPEVTAAMAVNEITRMQFLTPDEKKIIGVHKDNLSISVVRPYPGWEMFRPSIEKGLKAYCDTTKPKGIRRIGLRYINQIELDGNVPDILACFTCTPLSMDGANLRIENFFTRYEYLYNDEPIKVAIGFARAVAPAGKVVAVLDLDFNWQSAGDPLSLENAMHKVDDLRQRERVLFESLITDRARELFDA